MSEKDNKASKKSAIDYLKDELKERANENADFQASLQAKEKQLAAAREKAKNKNVLRKIKVVDSAISKKEIARDTQVLQDFKQAEQKKLAEARSRRSKEIASKNKKPIAALLSGLLVAGCAAGGFATHSHNVALAADYDQAVSYIMEEEYDKATDILHDLETADSEALFSYAYNQSNIEDYTGKPEEMLNVISGIDGIENEDVAKQQNEACEEIKLADEIQDDIDSLDLSSVETISENTLEEIDKLKPQLEERYAILLDTEKYDTAAKVLYNIENNTDAGLLIADINGIGKVTLDSKDSINGLKDRYDSLTQEDKKTVLNYSLLTDAENTYKKLKKKDDERIAAEKKAAEEKAAAEKAAAEEKAEAERIAAEEAEREAAWYSETVYLTPNGDCYHFDWCPALSRSKNLTPVSREYAISIGKDPCGRCSSGRKW